MHHFGLESFFNDGEHWILQASLPHSIKDELAGPSLASALDTLAVAGFCGAGVAGAEIGCAGVANVSGFSRSKFPLSAHAARTRASDKANSHFILSPVVQSQRAFCRNKLSMKAVKEMDLREGLLIS